MKDLTELARYRVVNQWAMDNYGEGALRDPGFGCFEIIYRGATLRVIASAYDEWDHVSISLPNRVPNWYELEYVKRLFFKNDETAIQYHVPTDEHINIHPNVLHLWRPHNLTIPLPPKIMV